MRRGVLFKTKRIAEEWPSVYPPLRVRLTMLADMVNNELGKPLTVTCLTRTPEENAKVKGKPDSLHMSSPVRAVDIRTTQWVDKKPVALFTTEEAMHILLFWRKGGRGFGGQEESDHIHLQCKP